MATSRSVVRPRENLESSWNESKDRQVNYSAWRWSLMTEAEEEFIL